MHWQSDQPLSYNMSKKTAYSCIHAYISSIFQDKSIGILLTNVNIARVWEETQMINSREL